MKIKVGDRVTVISSSIYSETEVEEQGLVQTLLLGRTGTVTDIVGSFVWPIQVMFDDTGKYGWFIEKELEVIEDEQE